MFKAGQWVYCVETVYDDFIYDDSYELRINSYLYMAECKDYIICCGEYDHYENDFEGQLIRMCDECIADYGIDLKLIKKELTFNTKREAKEKLKQLYEAQY